MPKRRGSNFVWTPETTEPSPWIRPDLTLKCSITDQSTVALVVIIQTKDFALMMTRYWKTLKTAENLAEKPDLTIGSCLNLAKLFVGV